MAWDIVYCRATDKTIPAVDFLDSCPPKVEAEMLATLEAVAEAPPPRFSGGGKWEAMHGDMNGYYEIRAQGPKREQFRLFCILENADRAELERRGLSGPAIAVISGMRKPSMTKFSAGDYKKVRRLGDDYKSRIPRSIAT